MLDPSYVEAYIAITNLKARYCRTLDTKDWEGFADIFTEDVELDTRPAGGPFVKGRDELVRMVRASIEKAATAHQVHSPEITLNGDVADVIWAMQDRVVWTEPAERRGTGLCGFGHYHERYVRQGGRWWIARQRLTRLHVDVTHSPGA